MARVKIDPSIEKLVRRHRKKAVTLGVRGLADFLFRQYAVRISKSTIHNILKTAGARKRPGPKHDLSVYKVKGVKSCGLILLKALDYHVGLFDYLVRELKSAFPKLKPEELQKLIILASFWPLSGKNLNQTLEKKGVLRWLGLKHLAVKKIGYFTQTLTQHKFRLDLTPLKEDLRMVSTLKFYFKNGRAGFSDAKLSTFWDGPCKLSSFFLPLRAVRLKLKRLLDQGLLVIGYTRSFGYLSLPAFDCLEGFRAGLEKIALLDQKGRVLAEVTPNQPKTGLIFGYSTQIVSLGVSYSSGLKRLQRFFWEELGQFYSRKTGVKFTSARGQELAVDNILVSREAKASPSWGLVSTLPLGEKNSNLPRVLKGYFYAWPYLSQDFFREMRVLDKSLAAPAAPEGNYLAKMLPQRLIISQPIDLVRVGQVLSAMFKEVVWGWEPKGKSGNFTIAKDHIRIFLKDTPLKVKKNFNRAGLYLGEKRIFII